MKLKIYILCNPIEDQNCYGYMKNKKEGVVETEGGCKLFYVLDRK